MRYCAMALRLLTFQVRGDSDSTCQARGLTAVEWITRKVESMSYPTFRSLVWLGYAAVVSALITLRRRSSK